MKVALGEDNVVTGVFGGDMHVDSICDGPINIIIEKQKLWALDLTKALLCARITLVFVNTKIVFQQNITSFTERLDRPAESLIKVR